MAKLQNRCPYCNKNVEVETEERNDTFHVIFKTLACGHTTTEDIVALKTVNENHKLVCKTCLVDLSGVNGAGSEHLDHELVEIPISRDLMFSRAMLYQQAGVEFLENANFNAALNDEQGLGKTIQALLAIKHHKDKFKLTLFVVKSKLKLNWAQEMVMNGWLCDKDDIMDYPFIVMDGQMAIIPGFRYYIVSMNMLEKSKKVLMGMGFDLLVVDESQNFANTKSQRTKALLEIAGKIPHKICMSGTPVLNRASEYWPTLNMIRPDHWLNYEGFLRQWVDYELTEKGAKRYTGLKRGMRDMFFNRTKNYILRRNKRDVLKDLPPFQRTFEILDCSDSVWKGAYNDAAQELEDFLNSEEYLRAKQFERSARTLGYLMRMRHLTGLLKTPGLIEDVVEWLETTEDREEKLIIGCHHDDVMDQLKMALAAYNPIVFGSDDVMEKIEEFKKPGRRLAILKILASGEGLNLQFCPNMIVFERQWNAGKEEQFEARIDRPLKCPNDNMMLARDAEVLFCRKCDHKEQVQPKRAMYKIAKNTVDEVFTQMVEEKRKHCGETIDRDFNFEADPALLSLLGERASKLRI